MQHTGGREGWRERVTTRDTVRERQARERNREGGGGEDRDKSDSERQMKKDRDSVCDTCRGKLVGVPGPSSAETTLSYARAACAARLKVPTTTLRRFGGSCAIPASICRPPGVGFI